MKKILKKATQKGLSVLEKRAERKANAECMAFVYEPKIPKKLKKTLCVGLACLLAISGVLIGSADMYKADTTYYDMSWQTRAINPGNIDDMDTVLMYHSPDQTYEWSVKSCTISTGYGMVTLSSTNVTLTMLNGLSNKLTQIGTREFNVSKTKTGSNAYVVIRITMDYDGYQTVFGGRVTIQE